MIYGDFVKQLETAEKAKQKPLVEVSNLERLHIYRILVL